MKISSFSSDNQVQKRASHLLFDQLHGNVLFFRDDVQVKKVSAGKIDITINAIFSTSINQRELLVVQGVDLE